MSVGQSESRDTLYQQMTSAMETADSEDDVEAIRLLFEYYVRRFEQDSTAKYVRLLSQVALQNEDYDTHVQALVDDLGSRFIAGSGIADYSQRIEYLDSLLHVQDLSDNVKSQVYLALSAKAINDNACEKVIAYCDSVILYADLTENYTYKCSRRIQVSESLSGCNQYNEAIDRLLEAEQAAPLSSNSDYFTYKIVFNLGKLFLRIGDFDKADYYMSKADDIAKRRYKSLRPQVLFEQAKLALATDDIGQAERYATSGLEISTQSKIKNKQVFLQSLLAEIYLRQDRLAEAKLLVQQIQTAIDQNRLSYDKTRAYATVTNYHISNKDYEEAERVLAAANADLEQVDTSPALLRAKYLLAKERGNSDATLASYILYRKVQDSINRSHDFLQMQRLENDYNRKQKQDEIATLNRVNAAQDKAIAVKNTALWMGGIGLFILALLLAGLYRLYKKNQYQTTRIQKALEENKLLMREIHHRVKNNLQVISSLLRMQARRSEDGDTKEALRSTNSRIESVSILHQNLYQEDKLTDVNVKDYVDRLIASISNSYSSEDIIRFITRIDTPQLDVDQLVPIGLIINELVCNAVKYAFTDDQDNEIRISLYVEDKQYTLQVSDNGVGLPDPQLIEKPGSLGTRLIKSFTDRLDGTLSVDNTDGTTVTISWPQPQDEYGS